MIKIRLQGMAYDVDALAADLRRRFDVIDETPSYVNRHPSEMVRKYLTIRSLPADAPRGDVLRDADENRRLVAKRRKGE